MSDEIRSNPTKRTQLYNNEKKYDGAQETQTRVPTIITQLQMRVKIPPDPKGQDETEVGH